MERGGGSYPLLSPKVTPDPFVRLWTLSTSDASVPPLNSRRLFASWLEKSLRRQLTHQGLKGQDEN